MTRQLKFNQNGQFTILQVADAQDLPFPRRAMLDMLNAAYEKINPDLILFTGDNILGNHLLDARFGTKKIGAGKELTRQRMKEALAVILDPPEQRKIPFAMTFGNHDDMNLLTKAEQLELYRAYEQFVFSDEDAPVGNYTVPIWSFNGEKKLFNLWLLDTAWHDKENDRCHTGVTKEEVDWYVRRSNELKAENSGQPLPSLLFQHIPFPEIRRLMLECKPGDKGAVRYAKNKAVRLDPAKATGRQCEPGFGYQENNGQFDAIKAQGDVCAAVFSHHHINNFDGVVDGVRVIQSPGASFRCYGNTGRGVRVFVLNEIAPAAFHTYTLTYFDLCGHSPIKLLRYAVQADIGLF